MLPAIIAKKPIDHGSSVDRDVAIERVVMYATEALLAEYGKSVSG
jgi:glutamate dehydrogenase (NAD(P)+)